MKSVVTFAGDHADLASANRRTFLMQAGTSVGLLAAGMVFPCARAKRSDRYEPTTH
jgi:uncharacterized membrane protein YidH (DUF202 family)